MEDYSNVVVLESPESIERLLNWVSMLQVVLDLKINDQTWTVGIPKQIVINDKAKLFDRRIWKQKERSGWGEREVCELEVAAGCGRGGVDEGFGGFTGVFVGFKFGKG